MSHIGKRHSRFQYSPLAQLFLARLREFYRVPEAVFWGYGFPLLMILVLGIAFRSQPVERVNVDICSSVAGESVVELLSADARFELKLADKETCLRRLRTSKTDVVVIARQSSKPSYEYHVDPTKPRSLVARDAVDDVLQQAAGRQDPAAVENVVQSEPGGRYIDFLVPGLLGMGLMGGGLWGVGFATVDMRIRNLLKRFVATPMKKTDFLAALMLSRMVATVTEVLLLLVFSWLVFGVETRGSLFAVAFLVLLGASMFSGLGLLVACRAKTLEGVSGLMNLTMLPMWILSGIFFSTDRFPDAAQPLIKLLPLTSLIDALRAVMLDGSSLLELGLELGIMVVWTAASFFLALKWFRWT
jgi:ABC-type multidrug transport system permease subunit